MSENRVRMWSHTCFEDIKSKHRPYRHRSSNSRSNSRDDAEVSDEYSESINGRNSSVRDEDIRDSLTLSTKTTTTNNSSADEDSKQYYDTRDGVPMRADPLESYMNEKINGRKPRSPGSERPRKLREEEQKYYDIRINEESRDYGNGPRTHRHRSIDAPHSDFKLPTETLVQDSVLPIVRSQKKEIAARIEEHPDGMPRIKRQKSQTMMEMEELLLGVEAECVDSDRSDSPESVDIPTQINPEIKKKGVRFLQADMYADEEDERRRNSSFIVGASSRTVREQEAAQLVSMMTGTPSVRMFRVSSSEAFPTEAVEKNPETEAILEQFFRLLELRMDKEIDVVEFQSKACGILSEMGPEIDMRGRSRKLFEEMVPRNKRTLNAEDVGKYMDAKIENKLQVLRMMSALRSTKHMNQEEESRLANKVFHLLDLNQEGFIQSIEFVELLEANGLNSDDYRLTEFFYRLEKIHGQRNAKLGFDDFLKLIRGLPHTYTLIDMLFSKKLIVPDLPDFKKEVEEIFNKVKRNDGHPFAVSICTVDGQEFSIGDADRDATIQGIAKPLCYLLACDEHGYDHVHHHLGVEPSGKQQDSASLKPVPTVDNPKRQIPHNPFVEAGAITTCSLILPQENSSDRFSQVQATMARLCGGMDTSFCNESYLKLKASANREMCLAHMLQEYNSFPPGTKLEKTLDLYFQSRSLMCNTKALGRAAATLANGGKNPKSDDQIFDRSDVRNCLSLMLSSGMADASGLWGFDVGIPAKAARSGYLMCVIPNKMGLVIYAPPVDDHGCSIRGMEMMRSIVQLYNFHQYDNLRGVISSLRKKKDPTVHKHALHCKQVTDCIFACARGDLNHLTHLNAMGADIFQGDYDNRTGLHLAASEGHLSVCKYFAVIARKRRAPQLLNQQDRWGRTPLDDALSCNHQQIADFLIRYGATRGPKKETFRVLGYGR